MVKIKIGNIICDETWKKGFDDVKQYIKKPIPISAIQIHEEFEVETLEGIMRGKPGDYLIRGIQGEFYPCDKKIFEESYKKIS